MTEFNADECARLIASARTERRAPDRYSRNSDVDFERCDAWNDACDEVAVPLADQLEAAVREIDQMNAEGGAIYRGTKNLIAERDDLRAKVAKVAKLTEERDGMRAIVEAIDACVDDDMKTDFTYHDEWNLVVSTVNAYRAAKEKP